MPLRLIVVYGSVRSGRQGIRAARFVVNECRTRGHEVTVFHRGKSDRVLPAGVARILGDRHRLAEQRDALRERRPDVVVADTLTTAGRFLAGLLATTSEKERGRINGVNPLRAANLVAGSQVAALAMQAGPAAQQPTPPKGTLERLNVHGRALEGNLEGDSPDRPVVVYLPPSYTKDTTRRYPVLYLLPGFFGTNRTFQRKGFVDAPAFADKAFAQTPAGEFIIVMPDARNLYGGSFYTDSAAAGDWETFLVRDLVSYVDTEYRTVRDPAARGIAGHSMGGYAAVHFAIRYAKRALSATAIGAGFGSDPDKREQFAQDAIWRG